MARSIRHPQLVLLAHGLFLASVLLVVALWDTHPHYVRRGEGRNDAHFRKLSEDWDRFDYQDGKCIGNGEPIAALLGYPPSTADRKPQGPLRFAPPARRLHCSP